LRTLLGGQILYIFILWTIGFAFLFFFFPSSNYILVALSFILLTLTIYFFFAEKDWIQRLIVPAAFSIISLNLILNLHAYPELLKYQSGSVAAKIINQHNPRKSEIFFYRVFGNSFEFYTQHISPVLKNENDLFDQLSKSDLWIYTDKDGVKEITDSGLFPDNVTPLKHYHITMLTLNFLNPSTRDSQLRERYVLHLSKISSKYQ
jgi:hypothetical protein